MIAKRKLLFLFGQLSNTGLSIEINKGLLLCVEAHT
jgi:hypothetical protein